MQDEPEINGHLEAKNRFTNVSEYKGPDLEKGTPF
jgi:hypothetical protein